MVAFPASAAEPHGYYNQSDRATHVQNPGCTGPQTSESKNGSCYRATRIGATDGQEPGVIFPATRTVAHNREEPKEETIEVGGGEESPCTSTSVEETATAPSGRRGTNKTPQGETDSGLRYTVTLQAPNIVSERWTR